MTFRDRRSTGREMLYFTTQNRLQDGTSKVQRSGGCEMTILSSDILGYPRIIVESSFYWRKHSGSFR